ncbi:MAG: septum formation initiator family protein [Silvibacterium sp.]
MNGAESKRPKTGRIRRIVVAVYNVRRRIATGFAVVLAVFFAYHVMFGRNGVNSYEQKRVQDRELHQQIEALQQENSRLNDHVTRLKSDPDAIEYEAREKLHYARPGEVIYTLNNQPQPANDKASDPPAPTSGSSN